MTINSNPGVRKSVIHQYLSLSDLHIVRDFIRENAQDLGMGEDAIYDLVLAVDEAVTNIFVHGYKNQQGFLEITMHRMDTSLVVCLRDEAEPFDPTQMPAPDLSLPLEQRGFGGMGIFFMNQMVDKIAYRVLPGGGNELTLIKTFSGGN